MVDTYQIYRNALAGRRLPLAFVDLDRLYDNARSLIASAGDRPIRIATKSIRSVEILRRILRDFPQFRGLMAYSAAEAAHLAAQGFDDILIGYPTVELMDLERAAVAPANVITFMVCAVEHVDLLERVATSANVRLNVCIDLDLSWDLPGLHFGVRRSPLKTTAQVVQLAKYVTSKPQLRLRGLMGYDAQLAGVPDARPGAPVLNRILRFLKARSFRRIQGQRRQVVSALRAEGITIELFNGAGTGSLASARADRSLTEVTAGSGLYAPRLFDFYAELTLQPALGFALPVTRLPAPGWVTCHGGGYVASGAAGVDRLPTPYLPRRLRLAPHEGAGEVQTPLTGATDGLRIGDPVFFRHAKAGELCEHFDELLLLSRGSHVGSVKTYRGDGLTFL